MTWDRYDWDGNEEQKSRLISLDEPDSLRLSWNLTEPRADFPVDDNSKKEVTQAMTHKFQRLNSGEGQARQTMILKNTTNYEDITTKTVVGDATKLLFLSAPQVSRGQSVVGYENCNIETNLEETA